jgi:hypothetical protein
LNLVQARFLFYDLSQMTDQITNSADGFTKTNTAVTMLCYWLSVCVISNHETTSDISWSRSDRVSCLPLVFWLLLIWIERCDSHWLKVLTKYVSLQAVIRQYCSCGDASEDLNHVFTVELSVATAATLAQARYRYHHVATRSSITSM